ncbi:MAG TPA: DUF2332 domain-containing protein [Acidimicrobiales bacterium]
MVTRPLVLPLPDVLARQRDACERSGSALYGRLLDAVSDDVAAGGPCADLLVPHAGDPVGTALALRFLGAVHWLVLGGEAPALAAHYPSAGGSPGPGLVADFLATVDAQRAAIAARLPLGVQTNEVGRSATLVGGYAEVARRSGGLPLRVLELGASAGLNLRWDRFFYDTGRATLGDPGSGVRFVGAWTGTPPPLDAAPVRVVERAGCDRSPVDPTTVDGRRTLRSYVWPDQRDRLARLDAALEVAARLPARVDAADLGAWVEERLAVPVLGVATVVVHSIVWQYVGPDTRRRLRGALARAGAAATAGAPLAWLRMEPAGPVADLRLTWWPGGEEEVLGVSDYQGPPVRWGAQADADAAADRGAGAPRLSSQRRVAARASRNPSDRPSNPPNPSIQ